VKIWESRHKLEDYRLLNSYIFTIAYNNSIYLIRKKINNTKYLEHLKNSATINFSPTIISQIEFNELNNQAEKLIANLPERQKQVYLLHREEGLTYPEIAEKLGISKNTVENHMVKALKYLQGNCSGEEFDQILSWIREGAQSVSGKGIVQGIWEDFEPEAGPAERIKYNRILDKIHHQININQNPKNKIK